MSTKKCFTESADIRVDLVSCEHDRNATEAQDQGRKSEKSPWGDMRGNVASAECFPRHDGTEIDKHGRVEQQVSDIWEMGVLDLFAEPAIPSETVTSAKGYEEVIRAKDATHAYAEDCEEQIENNHAGRVHVASTVREAQESVEDRADHKSCSNAKGTLPEDSDEKIFLDSSLRISMNQCVQSDVKKSADESKSLSTVMIIVD